MEKKYIDLGLPSGNLWCEENEIGYYNFDEAVEQFKDNLPSKEDYQELIKHCYYRWIDERNGTEFLSAENGNRIFFHAVGYKVRDNQDIPFGYCDTGLYWSSSNFDYVREEDDEDVDYDEFNNHGYCLYIGRDGSHNCTDGKNLKLSIRLIKRK